MPSAWSRKDERQYRHILSSCGTSSRCRRIAAATVNKRRRAEGRALSGFGRFFAPEALATEGFRQGRKSWILVKPHLGPKMRITHEVLEGLPFEHSRRAMELIHEIKEPSSCEDLARNFGKAERAFVEAMWSEEPAVQRIANNALYQNWRRLSSSCLMRASRAFEGLGVSTPPPLPMQNCIAWKYVGGQRKCAIWKHQTGHRKPLYGSALR
jgi:hypothetical protein